MTRPSQGNATGLWLKIAAPVALSVALFFATIFLVHMPSIQQRLLEQKKKALKNTTMVVIDLVRDLRDQELRGEISLRAAQDAALRRIAEIRYGQDMKDYFWVNDLRPFMIMHPYTPQLDGTDLSSYADPEGKHLFVDMVRESEATGEAFVAYDWQWQDDPNRIVPKISYVRRFEPWGWIIGTGVYLDDIAAEARDQARDVMTSSLAILAVVTALALVSILQGLRAARRIQTSETTLRGIFNQSRQFLGVLGLDGGVRQINRTGLDFAGVRPEDVDGRPIQDAPWWGNDQDLRQAVAQAARRAAQGETAVFEARLPHDPGPALDLDVSVKPVRDEHDRVAMLLAEGVDITERNKARAELLELNRTLEERVRERTSELSRSLETIKRAQEQLVQSEKMAALGKLVAGVAHEINTPLGLGVTNATYIQEQADRIREAYQAGRFTKGEFEKFLERLDEATRSMLLNLNRGAEIIRSFKQVAVDQEVELVREIDLAQYLEEILLSLKPKYKHSRHTVSLDCPPGIAMKTFPGALMQILGNLVINSLVHGFQGIEAGRIDIRAEARDGRVRLEYADDGRGMTEEQKRQVYDPFYTTRRGNGGTGLGMHVVFNLVTQKLCGTISLETSPGHGVRFVLDLPLRREDNEVCPSPGQA